MPHVAPVTNDAEHKVAMARLDELINNCANDEEDAELRALGTVIEEYEMAKFDWGATDGAHDVEYLLDQGEATLDELYVIFGGRDAFIDFMTRRTPITDAQIDAMVAKYHTKREWLEEPFCEPEGWHEITKFDDVSWRQELMKYMPAPALAVN